MKIKNEVLIVLDSCRAEGNILHLPNVTLDRKMYQEVNKILEMMGGKWNRTIKGHKFEVNPIELIENLILTGEITDIKKEFQYFPTPKNIAIQMINMADIKPSDKIMEPSAGRGAIADLFPKENIHVLIEFNIENGKILKGKGYDVIIKDFLETEFIEVEKIIMNPPFSNQQDIAHVLHAFDLLKAGGTLVSIVSESSFFRENKKALFFREFLKMQDAEVIELPEEAFKESGTLVKTRIVKIKKAS